MDKQELDAKPRGSSTPRPGSPTWSRRRKGKAST